MKHVLALSTCWCSHRHHDGYEMLSEMATLGFDHVELSHGIRTSLVPGILRAVEAGVVRVTSTHNFCPLPMNIMRPAPNLFEPSSFDGEHFVQWVRHTQRSIEFAAEVNARVLVCHLGSVKFLWFNPGDKVRQYLRDHPAAGRDPNDDTYRALLRKARARLRRRAPRYWARVQEGIAEILTTAKRKGITLGFENRDRFEELPLDEDLQAFFASFPADAPVGYWHDVGHADLKERMGVIDHRAHLEQLAPRLLGFHLHDVNDAGHDHQPVGAGRIDFRMLSHFWRPEHTLVLELSPRVTMDEMLGSRRYLEDIMSE